MRTVFALIAALVSFQVHAQAVQQSGPITPGHAVAWTTNGVVQDGGAANFGALTEIGVTKDHGNGICQSTNLLLAKYQLICIGADSGTGASITLTGSPFEPLIFTNNGFVGISISDSATTIQNPIFSGTVPCPTLTGDVTSTSPSCATTVVGANSALVTATHGNTARTLPAHFGDVISIKDLGATGNGTTDDSAAFTTAFTTATIGTVLLPCGAYLITPLASGIKFNANHSLNLIGSANGCVTIKVSSGFVFTSSATIFLWPGRNDVTVSGITIDMNNATVSSGLISVIAANNSSGFTFHNNRIINASTGMLLFETTHYANFWVTDNYFALTTASTTQNQGILVSSAAGASTGGHIKGNRLLNTGMDIDASSTEISDNDISGWAYGAAITTEQSASCFSLSIVHNRMHDSATSIDVNSYAPAGMENWCKRSSITANIAWNNSGDGFDNGGANSTVASNVAYGNGTRIDGGKGFGFAARYDTSTYNGNGSIYSGNIAFDTGTGTQLYGYDDQSSSVANITFGINAFSGATGAMNIQGSSPVYGVSSTVSQSAATAQPFGTPSSSGAACTQGQVEFDASFVYTCSATNTWRRAATSSF